jgi:hypothetical protein
VKTKSGRGRQVGLMGTYKKRGEWAELKFMTRASELGLSVTRPWGESRRYEFVVESGGRFLRVQVKSTTSRISNGGGYVCGLVGGNHSVYMAKQVDAFAIYVIPADLGSGAAGVRRGKPHLYGRLGWDWARRRGVGRGLSHGRSAR